MIRVGAAVARSIKSVMGNEKAPNNIDSIKSRICEMYSADQDMRHLALKNDGIIDGDEDVRLDEKNTEVMKSIVAEIGWPTITSVGAEVSQKAWLLVQHADHDVEFQKMCLSLMKSEGSDVDPQLIAYLEDRVRVNEGRPQLYGTQFYTRDDGKYLPRPIEEPEHVDERRKLVGLDSLEEYRQRLVEKYGKS